MQKFIVGLLVALLVAAAGTTHAGERAHAVSISPFVGGYAFDGVQHVEIAPQYGLRLGYDLTKNWGVEVVGAYLATERTRSERTVNALSYGLDILYNFAPDGPVVPYLAVGGGGITVGHGSSFKGASNTDGTANAGLGLKYFLTDSVAVRADARQLFIFEDHNSIMYNWQYTAGLTILFGGGKKAPAPEPEPPPPPAPTSSLSVNPASITKGESATLSWTSQNATNCDIQPGIGPVNPQGSMPITPAADTAYTLTCSGPGGTSSSTANITVTVPPLPAPRYKYCTTFHPEFDICGAEIRPEYQNQITRAGTFMQQYPDTTAVIEGHTDNVPINLDGTCKYKDNMVLSQARAESAVNYLVEKFGIDRSRFTAKGYGDTRPIADNTTDAGRQKNRRIEAIIDCAILPQEIKPEEQLCMTLKVEFDFGKADVKAQYNDEIARLGEYMKEYPTTNATIEGHTDNVGSPESNMKLSQQRAENVVSYLVDKFGIDLSRLTAKGYGDTRPIAYNTTPEGRQTNRRIDAIVDCVLKK